MSPQEHNKEKCHAMLNDISVYLDGEAEQALCDEIERHMANCEDCRVVVDSMSKTVHLYREHGHTAMPDDAKKRLFAVLDLENFLPSEQD